MECKFCNKKCKNKMSLIKHQQMCKDNPNKIKSNLNTSDGRKAWNKGLTKNTDTRVKKSGETLSKNIKSGKTIVNRNSLSQEAKDNISKAMKLAVKKYPKSYSSNNVCGRVKSYSVKDSYGNETKLLGKWEVSVAEFLDKNKIKWTNKLNGFEYIWENEIHLYFPDFYLPELKLYIEVKGYERERDREKWKQFQHTLIILRDKEIKDIRNNIYNGL